MRKLSFYGHTPSRMGEEAVPGRLIVIEGTDSVGRSTQIAMLQEWMEAEGYAVLVTGLRRSEVAASGIDRAMRGNTLDALTLNLLYATDFWDRMERSIVPALRTGMVALVDRYIFSIIARARVRGVPSQWLSDVLEFALVPDKVLYLDVDVENLLPRVLSVRQLDHWESGEDFLRGPDLIRQLSSATKRRCSRNSAASPSSTISPQSTPAALSERYSAPCRARSRKPWRAWATNRPTAHPEFPPRPGQGVGAQGLLILPAGQPMS